jgi:EAL and modified HD-GYP domain-containing signal transduction protein
MNQTVGILLTPVMDRHGIWAGVWVRCGADCGDAITSFGPSLSAGTGDLRIFLDARNQPPATCLDSLPAGKTWIVSAASNQHPSPALAGRNFHAAVHGLQFVTGIENQARLDAAKAGGGEWFCGHFIAHPPAAAGVRDANRAVLLKLLALVVQDADSAAIEQVFKREPGLSFNLFRLVNSVSMGLGTKVSTFNQAIMVLGRRQMQRWIQLMLYTSNQTQGDAPNPLMQLAAMRAKLMECLALAVGWDAAMQERAFMAGIFSLLDSLLGMPMAEIVRIIPLPDDVQSALLGHEGALSELLAWVEGVQAGDSDIALPSFIGLDALKLAECQLAALRWAAGVGQEMNQA